MTPAKSKRKSRLRKYSVGEKNLHPSELKSKQIVADNSQEDSANTLPSRGRKKKLLFVAVLLLLVGAFLYYYKGLFIAALVNGRPITRLSLIRQLERTNGRLALESLINKSLIEQEALKKNIVVTDEEVKNELEKVKKDLASQGLTLDSVLSSQGLTLLDLEENLRIRRTVEQLLKDNIKVSDEEVKKYFEENKSLFGKDAKFDDLQDSIRLQLQNEKLTSEFQKWYQKLKEQSDIKYFVSF
jgi:hypothetical protein